MISWWSKQSTISYLSKTWSCSKLSRDSQSARIWSDANRTVMETTSRLLTVLRTLAMTRSSDARYIAFWTFLRETVRHTESKRLYMEWFFSLDIWLWTRKIHLRGWRILKRSLGRSRRRRIVLSSRIPWHSKFLTKRCLLLLHTNQIAAKVAKARIWLWTRNRVWVSHLASEIALSWWIKVLKILLVLLRSLLKNKMVRYLH